ncbi:hypothetical protein [Aureivirga sp. CE67]|uniref:hypothetical protein n=1 Tax=Aureivirga sp. CE67 TaxID=1788983 RepID=UPI0018CA658C|nr:hypothetical protein [Aureivirga sp. CE67]
MKTPFKLFIIFLILISTIQSCTTIDDGITRSEFSPIGDWELIAIRNSTTDGWVEVEESFQFSLFPNYRFVTNEYEDCTSGIFELENQMVKMNYDCNSLGEKEDVFGFVVNAYYFEDLDMVFSPKFGDCQDVCFYKFQRIPYEEQETE